MADITTGSGSHITTGAWNGHIECTRPHHYQWPKQQRPPPADWMEWQRALTALFGLEACNHRLPRNLGLWTDDRKPWAWISQRLRAIFIAGMVQGGIFIHGSPAGPAKRHKHGLPAHHIPRLQRTCLMTWLEPQLTCSPRRSSAPGHAMIVPHRRFPDPQRLGRSSLVRSGDSGGHFSRCHTRLTGLALQLL